jgi:aquaporin related protein
MNEGELIKRPVSPIVPASPLRAYHQPARITYSPERTPADFPTHPVAEPENIRGNAGLRRRPSNQPPTGRSQSIGTYDRERPSFSESDSRRPLRSRDDGYYREDERAASSRREDYHPDAYDRARPPRSYRNVEAWDRIPGSASKPYFEETRVDRDLERGDWIMERKRNSDEESIDGYNYDAHKTNKRSIDFKNLTAEERAEVMRLPWTQWMNSDVKNRKLSTDTSSTKLIEPHRFCGHNRRVCWHNHVPFLCLCWYTSSQYPI